MKNIVLTFLSLFILLILHSQNKIPETILVEGGTYRMGINESKYFDEFPDHSVTLNSFYIGKYEVTTDEYKGFCRTAGFEMPVGDGKMAASNISWEEAILYCNWLSRVEHLDRCYRIKRDNKLKSFIVTFDKNANGYRLPTEAEWEYAARAGVNRKQYAFSGSDNADEVAWYAGSSNMLHNVGELKPNDLGIYDMTGNVQEWCFDVYLEEFYKKSPKENPICEKGALSRVSRGGSFMDYEGSLRITKRFYNLQNHKSETIGFRVARNAEK